MQIPDAKEMAAQLRTPHGQYAVHIGEFMAKANERLYTELTGIISASPGNSILEIGPGTGTFIPLILSCGRNLKYTGIDLSNEMVQISKEKNSSLIEESKAQIFQGDCRKMNFSSESFDQVLGLNTVYFWDPIEIYLREIARVMNRGAKLYLAYRSKSSMMELPFSRFGFSLYEPVQMEVILSDAGFKAISSKVFQEEVTDQDGRKLRLDSVFTVASHL